MTYTRTTRLVSLTALVVSACLLSASPEALAAHGKRSQNGRQDRHATPAHPVERGSRHGRAEAGRLPRGGPQAPPTHHQAPPACAPSGAGIILIDGCAVRIGKNHKYRKIAKAFNDAGYQAYVRNDRSGVSVRVYGFPRFQWTPGAFDTHTSRQGSVLQIRLCRAGR